MLQDIFNIASMKNKIQNILPSQPMGFISIRISTDKEISTKNMD